MPNVYVTGGGGIVLEEIGKKPELPSAWLHIDVPAALPDRDLVREIHHERRDPCGKTGRTMLSARGGMRLYGLPQRAEPI
jgi:hypothetical protein